MSSDEEPSPEGDLIDLNVVSPILPQPSTAIPQSVKDDVFDNLIDTELPVLERRLQTATDVSPPNTSRRTSVDVEEILIAIDDDENCNPPTDANGFLDLSNDNLEALVVLKSLDDILNKSLQESDRILSQSEGIDNDSHLTIEDCLLDLDNYLKALDSSCDENGSTSASSTYNEDRSTTRSPSVFSEGSQALEDTGCEDIDEENLRNKLRLMEQNYWKFLAAGCVNRGYEDTETDLSHLRRPLSACGDVVKPTNSRKQPTCATVAVVRRERPRLHRNNNRRGSNCGSTWGASQNITASPPSDISSSLSSDSWPSRDVTRERHAHASTECCTGSVLVEPEVRSERTQEVTLENAPDASGIRDQIQHTWLRNSMRQLDRLNLPPEVQPTAHPPDPEPQTLAPPQPCDQTRPVSAPSRIGHTSRAGHSSRSRHRESHVSHQPSGGRSRSSSSRRRRSLSSSGSSVASSRDISSCRATVATSTRSEQPAAANSSRRSCDRTVPDPTPATTSQTTNTTMPEADSPIGNWPHSFSSTLACLGCTLGLFNLSRFAILSLHFGANFIFQFFFLSLVFGLPLFTLQLCLGQQLGAGVIDMWRISPLFQGVGVSLLVAQALLGLYSVVGVSWMFVYFRDSFVTKVDKYRWAEPFIYYRNGNELHVPSNNTSTYKLTQTVPDYFSGVVLQRHHLTSGTAYGTVKFQLAFNLAVMWSIIFVSLSKGLRSYGKVVYAFTLLPIVATFMLCAKILGLMPPDYVNSVFPETSWDEFFLNSKSWLAASQEAFLTWGLLGAAVMQIASHNKNKHMLQRDSSVVVIITCVMLLLFAFLANTCVQILKSFGYNYVPDSFERMSSYQFLRPVKEPLPPSLASTPVRYMVHNSFVMGEKVVRPGVDHTSESGYQVLRLATELVPATLAVLGSDQVSSFWSVLFYFILIMFGIAQQLAIWHCVITGIIAIRAKTLKAWETTITFFSCALGFILGLPMATELGIYVVYFFDYTVGGIWWLTVVVLLLIVAVFMVRGRPYSGDTVVTALFSQTRSHPCVLTWAPALLSFTWNVILPVALMVLCITTFRNGNYRDMFVWHHAPSAEYWPLWARQIGSMIQLIPILIVPLVAVIQSYRYLNNGPSDILDRIQLLYRPPIGEHMDDLAVQETQAAMTAATQAATIAVEDPPPKYTPPPSYTTATGARIAKFLRQSIRRSVRRIANVLGESSNTTRQRPQVQTQPPPPDYNAVLVEMNNTTSVDATDAPSGRVSTLERLRNVESTSTSLTAAEVASILRSSFRRSTVRTRNNIPNTNISDSNNMASLSAENLVDSAAPIGETSLVLHIENENKSGDNTSSVI